MPGRLITIEGIDGAGKTTLAGALADSLRERGIVVTALREPGGVALAERIRALVADPANAPVDRAEALLYAAARAQLVAERVRPALSGGEWVLLDRFVDSSLAYQGAGRSLGMPAIAALNEFATAGLVADRTLLLALPTAAGRERRGGRAGAADRLEREPEAFFEAVNAAYLALADAEPQRIRVIDASRAPAAVLADALAELDDLLEQEA